MVVRGVWRQQLSKLKMSFPVTAKRHSHVTKANAIIFRSRQTDCVVSPMKTKCCPNIAFRKIARSVHQAACDETLSAMAPHRPVALFLMQAPVKALSKPWLLISCNRSCGRGQAVSKGLWRYQVRIPEPGAR